MYIGEYLLKVTMCYGLWDRVTQDARHAFNT